jgi:GNAT superfamily N-acetyltransferase
MILRTLAQSDIRQLIRVFATPMTWWETRRQYQRYWQEQQAGQHVMLLAMEGSEIAGYVNVLWKAQYLGFEKNGIPEINDLVVVDKYRCRGIGAALMEEAEQLVASQGHTIVGLGCGNTAYYQAAQRLYTKRGYIPDGSGLQKTRWGLMNYQTKNLSFTQELNDKAHSEAD